MSEKYFAAQDITKVGTQIMQRVQRYYTFMQQTGIFKRQTKSAMHYFGVSPVSNASTDGIRPGGKQGQLHMIKVNHFRNLGQHLLQLTTSKKPAPMPIPTNSDAKSQKQVTVAKGIIEYYSREKRVQRSIRQAVEKAIIFGQAFIQTVWGPGQVGQGKSGQQSDVHVSVLSPSQVIRDPNKNDYNSCPWIVTRQWIDRFQAASQYAGEQQQDQLGESVQDATSVVRQRILGQRTKTQYNEQNMPVMNLVFRETGIVQSDDIALYHFWHKRTRAVPQGRYCICLQDGTVVYDGPLPYQTIPVRRIAPSPLQGTPFGYTPMFDMIVLQQAVDALYSAVATNQMTFGVQLIMAMKGSDIDYRQLAKGLSLLQYSDPNGKPQSLNLTHTPAQVFQFIAQLEKSMQTISGVNSVVRGDPPNSLKSGSALALVQAQAIQYSSGLQQSNAHLMQDVYTDILNILKRFANDKKTVTIVGKFNRSMLLQFNKSDIEHISRVTITIDSALQQTQAGRMQMAQDLIQSKLLRNPQEYISLVKTGSLDPLLKGDNAQLILIRTENEQMVTGKAVSALATDSHSLHIREHKSILATPQARNNPQLMRMITDHMVQHVKYLSDPGLAPLLMVLGEQPLSMVGQPQPGQGYAPGAGGPQGGPPQNAPDEQGDNGEMANMPKNPLSGETWNPEDGGMPQ